MTNLEMLRTATPEQIRDMFCEEYCGDCDACPSFLSDRCKNGRNGVLAWLNEKAIGTEGCSEGCPERRPKGVG